jgi:hypothetical protein
MIRDSMIPPTSINFLNHLTDRLPGISGRLFKKDPDIPDPCRQLFQIWRLIGIPAESFHYLELFPDIGQFIDLAAEIITDEQAAIGSNLHIHRPAKNFTSLAQKIYIF